MRQEREIERDKVRERREEKKENLLSLGWKTLNIMFGVFLGAFLPINKIVAPEVFDDDNIAARRTY